MTSIFSVRQAVRHALMVSAITAAASATALAADEEKAATEVVVTGSRIANSDLDAPAPVQTVSAADIQSAGIVNIQELLLENPVFGTPTFSRTNSNFLTASAGVATIDLRDLGISRTLVLVNGRRFVAGIPGDSAVDLNAIPTQFIERVEVLTGGASAIYGSDAVSGVVNIIYKKNFEGVEVDGQYGKSSEGDSKEVQGSITMGVNVADGRGNILAHIGYTNQGAVFSRDRARSAVDQFSTGAGVTGGADEFFNVTRPFYSSFAPQGRFTAGPTTYTYNAAGQLITGFSTNGTATRAPDGFNRSAYRTIAVPTERYLAALQGDYEIFDHHNAFIEATYVSTRTQSRLEPFPLDSINVYPTNARLPIEFPVFTATGTPGVFTRTFVANPLVPTAIFNSATDTDGDGAKDIAFTRRMADVAARGNSADRGTFRVLGGVHGELIPNSTWNYEVYYAFGQTGEAQTSTGQINVLNFRNALEVIQGANGPICRDAQARQQGCVPANIFGANTLSPGAANYINAPGSLNTYTSQKDIGASVTGELFNLPAGAVGLAAGVEYRKEFSSSAFDALQQAGLNAGNAIPATRGEFSVKEAYAETKIPLLSKLPGAEALNFRGAYRYSDYTSIGTGDTWNLGLEWTPFTDLRFRVVRAQSTRAPNIGELFQPPSQTFPTGLQDPCIGVTATSSTPQSAACRAAPGVNANIAANGGVFTLNQADIQGISGFNRGNPNAQEEVGRSWVGGFVYTPHGIPVLSDFSFTVDYYDVDISAALVSTPRPFILQQCYNSNNPLFCQFITRRPVASGANSAGSIQFIDSAVTNSGGLRSEGIDVTMAYTKDLSDWNLTGNFTARLSYSHLMNGFTVPLPGASEDSFAGEIGSPKDSAFISFNYSLNGLRVSWQTTYIGASRLDDQFLSGFRDNNGALTDANNNPVSEHVARIGSWIYHDIQVGYSFQSKYEVYAGARNLLDKDPPPIISGLPGDVTGTETDAGTYDAIGRRYYAGFRFKF